MDHKLLLNELKKSLNERLGNIILQVILFGSRVNGTPRDYSDYDVLIVLLKDYNSDLEWKIYDSCYDLDIKYDIIIDAKLISKNELSTIKGKQPFITNAIETGIHV